jgi:hypothetical protein
VIANLERAQEAGLNGGTSHIKALIFKIREAQQELHSGRQVTRTRLDEIQKEVDALAAQ